MTDTLSVREDDQDLAYSFDDLMRYHGFGYPGGVAHAFKVLQRALPLLAGGAPPERREIVVRTAFRGPGARDGFELVTRGLTDGRYTVDAALERPERGETLARYVFHLSYRGTTLRLWIREGLVRDAFIALGRQENRTADEEQQLMQMKQEMTARLLAVPAVRVYDVV